MTAEPLATTLHSHGLTTNWNNLVTTLSWQKYSLAYIGRNIGGPHLRGGTHIHTPTHADAETRTLSESKSSSCQSLKKSGHLQSNLYNLKRENDKFPRISFCDMENSEGYDSENMESLIGYLNYSPIPEAPVFSVYTSYGSITPGGSSRYR